MGRGRTLHDGGFPVGDWLWRPFLEVIRSEDTTGPITGLALSTINKFLSYGLIGEYMLPAADSWSV